MLVGFRGAGKTTVGRLLARRLGRPFVDLDRRVEDSAGTKVARIFRERGEDAFRTLEEAALAALRAERPAVVATGGGVVEKASARRRLRALGTVVWIQVAETELVRRLGRSRTRPSLTGRPVAEEARALLRRRRPLYREVADRIVRAGGRPAATLARSLAERLSRDAPRRPPRRPDPRASKA